MTEWTSLVFIGLICEMMKKTASRDAAAKVCPIECENKSKMKAVVLKCIFEGSRFVL